MLNLYIKCVLYQTFQIAQKRSGDQLVQETAIVWTRMQCATKRLERVVLSVEPITLEQLVINVSKSPYWTEEILTEFRFGSQNPYHFTIIIPFQLPLS